MESLSFAFVGLFIANLIVSYRGFKDRVFFDRYKFEVDPILIGKEYERIVSSGFLHVNWMHFAFNMLTLYFFSDLVEYRLGVFQFLIVYFAGLIGGDLLSLYIHRNHADYSAVGASGAVSGIIFAAIALFPGIEICMFGLFCMPSWLYGLLFVVISIYGIRSGLGNIGHDAHLGGALTGMFTAIAFVPYALTQNLIPILILTIPSLLFIYLIVAKPYILMLDNPFGRKRSRAKHLRVEHRADIARVDREKELDRILQKIKYRGKDSLTEKEKAFLAQYSDGKS